MEKNTQPQRDAAARIQNPTVRAIVLQPPSGTDPSGSYTGKPLTDWMAEQPDTRGQADLYGAWRSTVAAGWDIVQGKGCTEFGIGAAAAAVIKAILHDEKAVLPCSTLLDGPYGQHGVYASVPCILGAAGVEEVIELTLSRDEAEGFAKSCAIIREHCEKL